MYARSPHRAPDPALAVREPELLGGRIEREWVGEDVREGVEVEEAAAVVVPTVAGSLVDDPRAGEAMNWRFEPRALTGTLGRNRSARWVPSSLAIGHGARTRRSVAPCAVPRQLLVRSSRRRERASAMTRGATGRMGG